MLAGQIGQELNSIFWYHWPLTATSRLL